MHGDVRVEDDGALWVMTGEIDAEVQVRVEDILERALESAHDDLVVDLSGVTFMDSAGLRLLYRAASQAPRPPRLRGVPGNVRDLLELTAVAPLFDVEADEDEAPAVIEGVPASAHSQS